MINKWYALYDEHRRGRANPTDVLNWNTLQPAQENFIRNLTPELRSQLAMWRNRNAGAPGVRELTDLLLPVRDSQGNMVLSEAGRPTFLTGVDLLREVREVLLTSAGYTEEDLREIQSQIAN